MKRYWDVARDLYPHPRSPAPATFWREQVQNLAAKHMPALVPAPKTVEETEGEWRLMEALTAPALRAARADTKGWPRTVHCIGSLSAGGAERQLVNLLVGLKRRGHSAQTLLTISPLQGSGGHYADLLRSENVSVRTNNCPIRDEGVDLLRNNPEKVDLLRRLPPEFSAWSLDLWVELSLLAPDIAHFWLDHPNIWGAPAALLADVPSIVLSTRNVNPSNFPYLYAPYMHDWYKRLEKCPRVRFINNSLAGALSYSQWMGVAPEKFEVILNGVDLTHLKRADAQVRRDIRREFGIPEDAPAVVGAFRLSEEKRPLLFVDTVALAAERVPGLHAVLVGDGPLRQQVEERADALGIASVLRAVGSRSDIAAVLSSMDVLLHTAFWEGTPNVVLEAQQLQLPVVVADGGGAGAAVDHGGSGLLVPKEDEPVFAEALTSVLKDLPAWKARAASGPDFVARRFAVERMIDETLAFQFRAVGLAPTVRREHATDTRRLVVAPLQQ